MATTPKTEEQASKVSKRRKRVLPKGLEQVATTVYRATSENRRTTEIVVNGLDHPEWQAIVRRAAYGPHGIEISTLANRGVKRLAKMRRNEFEKTAERFIHTLTRRKGSVSLSRELEPQLAALMEKHGRSQREVILVATAYEALEVLKNRSLQSFEFIADMLRSSWEKPEVRTVVAKDPERNAFVERYMRNGLGSLVAGFDDGSSLPEIATLINTMGFNARDVLQAANECKTVEEFRKRHLLRREKQD